MNSSNEPNANLNLKETPNELPTFKTEWFGTFQMESPKCIRNFEAFTSIWMKPNLKRLLNSYFFTVWNPKLDANWSYSIEIQQNKIANNPRSNDEQTRGNKFTRRLTALRGMLSWEWLIRSEERFMKPDFWIPFNLSYNLSSSNIFV